MPSQPTNFSRLPRPFWLSAPSTGWYANKTDATKGRKVNDRPLVFTAVMVGAEGANLSEPINGVGGSNPWPGNRTAIRCIADRLLSSARWAKAVIALEWLPSSYRPTQA